MIVEMFWLLSILLECVIVVLCFRLARGRNRGYGYALALTFSIYVIYDLAKQLNWPLAQGFLNFIFLVATLSALWAIVRLSKSKY